MSDRIIIGVKCQAKSDPNLGLVNVIAEEVNGKLVAITEENFCQTKQVFIVGRYDEIEKFDTHQLFKLQVSLSQTPPGQEKTGVQCKYKAYGQYVSKLQPNDLGEVIQAELPEANDRSLYVDILPLTRYLLIKDKKGDFYGPFDWELSKTELNEIRIDLKIITGGNLGRTGRTLQICKVLSAHGTQKTLEINTIFGKKIFIQNISNFITGQGVSFLDYASDLDIINNIKNLAGDNVGRNLDRKSFNALVQLASNSSKANEALFKNRIEKFQSILNNRIEFLDILNETFIGFLRKDLGEKYLNEYIQNNKTKFIDSLKKDKEFELNDELKRRQDELSSIETDLISKRKEKATLNDELLEAKRKTENATLDNQLDYSNKLELQLRNKIAELKQEEDNLLKRINEIKVEAEKYNKFKSIADLIIEKENIIKYLDSKTQNNRAELKELEEETKKAEVEIRKKLRIMKPYVDHLNGAFGVEDTKVSDIKVQTINFVSKQLIPDQRSLVESVKSRLNAQGRDFDDHAILNLLISTQQSFITFIAGLPGVGKTSLCNLFTHVQGLTKRSHKVQVARGWTSIKDIIGFYNPLNDKFQPASTGLYEFLSAINSEADNEQINPMCYITLDEANLSSIEHYWSSFMGMTDSTVTQEIQLGQEKFNIPTSLRFLATINYDGTTEPLSPRILDRASVIILSPNDISLPQAIDLSTLQDLPISAKDMHSTFGLFKDFPRLEENEQIAFNSIKEVLKDQTPDKGRSIHISQRKIAAIHHYCGRAREIMDEDGNEPVALDWAVLQHVLPQVTGHGSKFGTRLQTLKKCLEDHGLEKSAEHLSRMIDHGQNDLHSYEFFCW